MLCECEGWRWLCAGLAGSQGGLNPQTAVYPLGLFDPLLVENLQVLVPDLEHLDPLFP